MKSAALIVGDLVLIGLAVFEAQDTPLLIALILAAILLGIVLS